MADYTIIFIVLAGIIFFFVFMYYVPINLWITAIFSGVKVGLFELVFMRIRKVPPRIIVESLITATKAG
ncbi:MAG: flotillin-like FloA family protein, partial [Bacteroidetes bacterium]|nr:flotillin-like FloA family protein [Bacteroidota bacterium]